MRSALLLTLGTAMISLLARALPLAAWLPGELSLLAEMAFSALAFGGGAALGLCVLDGEHRRIVPIGSLSRDQTLWLSLMGALAVCPAALLADLLSAPFTRYTLPLFEAPAAASAARVVKSVLLVPAVEELFFRGYLLFAIRPRGTVQAVTVSALCFALVHAGGFAGYALLGVLLCLVTLRTGSILAPVLVHACYNLTLLTLGSLGLSGFVMGWSLMACLVRVIGCAAFAAAFKRMWRARRGYGTLPMGGERMTRREIALLFAAGALLLAATIIGG